MNGAVAVLAGLLAALVPRATAAAPEDAFGIWRTGDGRAAVELLPCAESLCGRLVWYVETRGGADAGLDSRNPDPAQRARRLCGLPLLGGFRRDGGNGWSDGWVYDPASGNRYSGTIVAEGADRLGLRGYVGLPLFGRSERWTRAPADQERCR